jgi:phosphatidylglycerophosphate synthase
MADLTEKDLENMKNHKYQTTGYTYIDNKMNPFWEKCASFLPYAFTPNMVTVTGLFCQILSVIIISFYDLTFTQPVPTFIPYFCALMLFLAQTLDAIDGKHARRTKRSSPLGQLMDHGCDSMDNFLYAIVISQIFLFGDSVNSVVIQILIQLPFYTYTLEEHYTGKLRTQINNIGVTEYQFTIMGLLIIAGIFGDKLIWMEICEYRLAFILIYICVALSIIQTIYLIFLESKNLGDAFYKYRPILLLIAFFAAEIYSSKLIIYQEKALLIIILNGMYYSLYTCKLIINNTAKRDIQLLDIDIVIYIIGIFVCIYFEDKQIELYIIIGLTVWLCCKYYYHIISAIFKMLNYLKIPF